MYARMYAILHMYVCVYTNISVMPVINNPIDGYEQVSMFCRCVWLVFFVWCVE